MRFALTVARSFRFSGSSVTRSWQRASERDRVDRPRAATGPRSGWWLRRVYVSTVPELVERAGGVSRFQSVSVCCTRLTVCPLYQADCLSSLHSTSFCFRIWHFCTHLCSTIYVHDCAANLSQRTPWEEASYFLWQDSSKNDCECLWLLWAGLALCWSRWALSLFVLFHKEKLLRGLCPADIRCRAGNTTKGDRM